jgi:hypothetical protein
MFFNVALLIVQIIHMRYFTFLVFIIIASCQVADTSKDSNEDSIANPKDTLTSDTSNPQSEESKPPSIYFNERFKDVIVRQLGANKFLIHGRAQVFEANISWVIEDGHDELKQGHVTTDAGAPEWGNFSFTVEAIKNRENSSLLLILFESSAKDGSRQHELPILLY